MKPLKESKQDYFEELKKRSKVSRVHRSYQLTGLNLAKILNDAKHKSLYIRLAKKGNAFELLRLAKTIAEKPHIKNRGAYFMTLFAQTNKDSKLKTTLKRITKE